MGVPKTIQIRDLDDDVYAKLAERAAKKRISVPEYLRQEATRLASRMTPDEWLESTRRPGPPVEISPEDVVATLDTWRGPWPDADR